jgi:hypothetical protein
MFAFQGVAAKFAESGSIRRASLSEGMRTDVLQSKSRR